MSHHVFTAAAPLLSEDVFDAWNLATLHTYCQQNELEYDLLTLQRLLDAYETPPAGFIWQQGDVLVDSPYWFQEDLLQDIAIMQNDCSASDEDIRPTLALQHDEMAEFLDILVSTLPPPE